MPQKEPRELINALCPHCRNLETVEVFEEGGRMKFVCMACRGAWEDRRARPRPGAATTSDD